MKRSRGGAGATALGAAVSAVLCLAARTVAGECPEVVSKADWRAGPVAVVERMAVPVPFVVIHHTYIPGACNSSVQCAAAMRSMQRFHQGKGWNDIGYNFAIGSDGRVYQGRGWDVVGAHAPKYNFMSIGIAFIGDHRRTAPDEELQALAQALIGCGVERGSISADYKLLGHRQVRDTECPGDALFTAIRGWPHWDPMIDIVPREPTPAPSAASAPNTTTASADANTDTPPTVVPLDRENSVNGESASP